MNRFGQVSLADRLAADPEISNTKEGNLVTSFPIAVNPHGSPDGEDSDCYVCTAYGRVAEDSRRLLRKGTSVWVEGTLTGRQIETRRGFRR